MDQLLTEIPQLFTPGWWTANVVALVNVIMIDLVLAGDNAVIVGLAASRVAPHMRAKVIFWGIAGAVILRILFALVTAQLLAIPGLMLFGGLLLFYVCWKMYQQLTMGEHGGHGGGEAHDLGAAATSANGTQMSFGAALWSIVLADVTMSLDNVLAVAGAAKGSPMVLVIGLAVAIVMMAVASHYIAKLLVKYPVISWVGLAIIIYVAAEMTYKGGFDLARYACANGMLTCSAEFNQWLGPMKPLIKG
jgi:YjbE family integral membrane protein